LRKIDFQKTWLVDIILAQAPLFSVNPAIGKKMGWIGMYHSAIILAQNERFWTLEFAAVTNVLSTALPTIRGDELTWSNDARYCITEGILWGREHWSETYDVVMTVNSAHARRAISDFVGSINTTSHGSKPQYQMFKVVSDGLFEQKKTLIDDITCSQGIVWFLDYIARVLGVPPRKGFKLRLTSTEVHARSVELVNTTVEKEWADVVDYFKHMASLAEGASPLQIVWRLATLKIKYIYDANDEVYYRIHGNHFPSFWTTFHKKTLVPPPWQRRALPQEATPPSMAAAGIIVL